MGHPDQSEWEDEVKQVEWFDSLHRADTNSIAEAYFGEGSAPFADETNTSIVKEALAQFPLLRFSVYTELQKRAVVKAGHDVLDALDRASAGDSQEFHGAHLEDAYGRFFLWLCAAYEIVRTMRDAKSCFSLRIKRELVRLTKTFEELRVPFAKQQMPTNGRAGRNIAIRTECSLVDFSGTSTDLKFSVRGNEHSARGHIADFAAVFGSIETGDVLRDLRTTQKSSHAGS